MATSALIQTHVFDRIYMFPPTVLASVNPYPANVENMVSS
jgi:hypothetical protein